MILESTLGIDIEYESAVARKARIQYEGAAYHVMSRGNGGADIFYGDKDRILLLDTLDEACSRTAWEIHAWVLMRNHYHLLLVTPHANLVEGMKWFQGTFTQRFNARHQRRGHLFQGRYRAQNIDENSDEGYFRTVANYIHLNPWRAMLLGRGAKRRSLSNFRWSSLPVYLGAKRNRPAWLQVERVLAEHNFADTPRGRRLYEDCLEGIIEEECGSDGKESEEYRRVRRGWFLGGESFREDLLVKVEKLLGAGKKGSLEGGAVKAVNERRAEQIVKICTRVLCLTENEWAEMPKTDLRKAGVVTILKRETSVSNDWIRKKLHMGHETNVSNASRRFREGRSKEISAMRKRLAKAKF